MRSPYYFYMPFALLFLALTVGFSYLNSGRETLETYAKNVEQNLQREMDFAKAEIWQFKQQILQTQKLDFSTLLAYPHKYSIFIYQNESLSYWSDNRYKIDNEQITGKFTEKIIENNHGIFLIVKDAVLTGAKTQDENEPSGERYQLVSVIPLFVKAKENQYVSNSLNSDIFGKVELRLSFKNDEGGIEVKSAEGRYFFTMIFPLGLREVPTTIVPLYYNLMLIFALFTIIFTFLQIRLNVLDLVRKGKIQESVFVLAFSLFVIRFLMIQFEIPFSLIDYDLFNIKYYASSIAPSLGDLFLNVLTITLLGSFIYFHYHQLLNLRRLHTLSVLRKTLVAWGLITLTFGAFWVVFYMLESIYFDSQTTIYFNSQTTLDINSDLNFNVFKIVCFLIFILGSLFYFFVSHISSRLLLFLYASPLEIGKQIIYASLCFLLFLAILGRFDAMVFTLNLVYLCLITFLQFPKTIRVFKYYTFIYLFVSALVSAAMGAYSIYIFEKTLDARNKKLFANQLLIDNDGHGEVLLNKAIFDIQQDEMIKSRLLSMATSRNELVIKKVKRIHLSEYFDKYDVSVLIFDPEGNPLNSEMPFDSLKQKYAQAKYKTEYPNLFFIKDLSGNAKHYLVFINIERNRQPLGRIALNLRLKKIIPNSVYPNLFMDKGFADIYEQRDISYAIYQNQKLLYSYGDFNYGTQFLSDFLQNNSQERETELTTERHRHLLIKGEKGRAIIISSAFSPARSISANFSFLFIILFIFKLLLAGLYNLVSHRISFKVSFSAKIQVYANLAYSLPLFLVSLLIISLLNNSNKNNTKETYLLQAENVAGNVVKELENYRQNLYSDEQLLDLIDKTAKLTQSDINLFDQNGLLIASSQPLIFENDLLANLINPQVMSAIIEKGQGKVMLTESVGKLEYNAVYVGVKSFETGELLGVIGVPFFESQKQYEKQIIDIVSTILRVFTFIFIALIGISYFASQILTQPLRLIAQKINITNLNQYNEPLDYKADDEIGLLVGAYNNMVVQLEESKKALSRSEKESAWREMARQVAHEIKNPLTPMKLTLQNLVRVLKQETHRSVRSVESLLSQIDTLTDIANSFSSFANMPIPKNEEFELAEVLRQTVALYKNDEKAQIITHIPKTEFHVIGDRQLMGRIFTNLIINGIQAVPHERRPQIEVSLRQENQKVIVKIQDNGTGIDETIRQKVFLPNFSTKFTGSGIGLALAKRGIEHAGGQIWFETEMGVGTAFLIEMPLMERGSF